ncbi:mitochondrial import inner membrane translocase subunit Tim29 [Prorops nasuta]|uniref:mitochondrial import inner membrane translocase subunit Tim29 n=1 Tax=Prorops nasuta TaxID=863751 RepID=UPI0034CFB1D1
MATRRILQINRRIGEVLENVKSYELPERFKGTFLERWVQYWKNLYIDYKEVAIDVAKESREKPLKAATYITLLGSSYYICKHNPDEDSFREQLLQSSMKVMQVGEAIRNPETSKHVKFLESCYNEGVIRHISLGLFSFIWIDNYDKDLTLYKAVCKYLKPEYLTFHKRIVDIGFLDKWWLLEKKMIDYDINETEFI